MKKNFIKECMLTDEFISVCHISIGENCSITIYSDENGNLYTDVMLYCWNDEDIKWLGLEDENKNKR